MSNSFNEMRISRDEQTLLELIEKKTTTKQMNGEDIQSLYVDMNNSEMIQNKSELIYFGDDIPQQRMNIKNTKKGKNGFSNNLFGIDMVSDNHQKRSSLDETPVHKRLTNDSNSIKSSSDWFINSMKKTQITNTNNPFKAFEEDYEKQSTNPFLSNGFIDQKQNDTSLYCNHERNSSSSSSESSFLTKITGRPLSRSVDDFIITQSNNSDDEETIYAEIVSSTDFSETTDVRKTRESDNPILCRVQQQTNLKRVSSMNSVMKSSSTLNGHYGTVSHNYTPEMRSRSMERPPRRRQYENAYIKNEFQNTVQFSGDIYQNSPIKNKRILHRHSLHIFPENIDEKMEHMYGKVKNNTHTDKNTAIYKRHSFYENMIPTGNISLENEESRPINIEKVMQTHTHDMIYSQINITPPKSKSPPSVIDTSCSLASSPPGSVCSSMSSELSSPPPLPSSRKSIHRMGSWSNFSYNPGQNYFPANYLGRQVVTKVSNEVIDNAISFVAEHTSLLEMRPVQVEIANDFIRFGTVSSPWELIVSFGIEEIISFAVVLKNAFFLGIVTGKPAEEAVCHVLQADRCNEIADAVSASLKSNSKPKIVRSQSSFEIRPGTIPPERQVFHSLMKVGVIKAKKSFLVVNDYVAIILEKVNPKDFKNITLEISSSNIIVTDSKSEIREDSHATSAVLSIGIYEPDKRYFGYIVSETGPNSKTKFYCHVYRASRNLTALNIVDSLKATVHMKDYSTVRKTSNTEINPIYLKQNAISDNVHREYHGSERISSVSTSGYSTSSFLSSISSSPELNSVFSSSLSDHMVKEQLGSTETLLTLTPGPNSSSDIVRSSDVITETRYKFESIEDCTNETADPSSSPKYQQINSIQSTGKSEKHSKSNKSKKLFSKFKQSIRHKQSSTNTSQTYNIYSEPLDISRLSMEPGLYHFNVSYICSTVISSPLKQKHVRDCYKQYIKEITKVGKNTGKEAKIGSTVSLQVISKEGVSMLDPNQASCIIKGFTLDQYDSFVQHPEESTCFAFSTIFTGHNKLKCHLFTCSDENPSEIEKAFNSMSVIKAEFGNNDVPDK